MATTHRSDLVDELEKALRDEAYDGGFGYMGDEQFTAYVRTLAVAAAKVVEEAHTPTAGSCWDAAPRVVRAGECDPTPTLCELTAGHQGAHRSGQTEWMHTRPLIPTDDEREALRAEAEKVQRAAWTEIHGQDPSRTYSVAEVKRLVYSFDNVLSSALRRSEVPEPSAEDQGPAANCHLCVGAGGYEDHDGTWVPCSCQRKERRGEPSDAHLRGRWSNGDPVHIITDGVDRRVAPNHNGATWIPEEES